MKIHFRLLLVALFLFLPSVSYAGVLEYASDLLSTSAPSYASNHTFQFTTQTDVPASGKIYIEPQVGSFDIPTTTDYRDIDLLVATPPGGYSQYMIGSSTPTASTSTVNITDGTSGRIIINLPTTQIISAGDQVRVTVGTHSVYGTPTSTSQIINPSATTSHSWYLATLDSGGDVVDSVKVLVAIVDLVTVGPADTSEEIPPVRSNGAPIGEIPYGTDSVEISLNTDELATCRYSTTASTSYAAMVDSFPTTGQISHSGLIVSDLEDNVTYSYYVRCTDDEGNDNVDDYEISFYWGLPPGSGGSGTGSGGGSGGQGGGGGTPFPPTNATVEFSGLAFPLSTLTILQDGTVAQNIPLGSDGSFDTSLSVNHGTYTFGLYATDANGVKSTTFNSTFSLVGGTTNTVTDVFIAPTLVLDTDRVEPGGVLGISGIGQANSTIEIVTHQQKANPVPSEITTLTTTTDADGQWSTSVDTAGFFRDTYQIRVRSLLDGGGESDFSDDEFYGVGVNADPKTFLSADLNRDGSVNLIDFSILLFHWGTDAAGTDPPADINQDGTVSLTDFSIMLFQWTG
jgi:hypothetical protein